ncbi:ethanolamine ammonia-lyase reactivating factor EutA [Halococcus sediminicola]|uniref:ethanolamine ammonia-lyase reactivating factor EutA n=1 Tax=Halococcus sediminicola TaxID=1264579 RepID=UPI000679852F|nr:ethanolamine ammonia-lyase reactivating factor EutA [Halococcus sediminicola]
MSERRLTSIGIDIGTTTTQVLLSELTVGTAGHAGADKLVVTDREILHRGEIHRTRLLDAETVDIEATASIVHEELAAAGVAPSEIDTGAVIVTGETAHKDNAEPLVHRLAIDSGEFVAATAGAALEAVLAGRGAGTATRAIKTEAVIANVDIGGGTTNIAVFDATGVRDTRCIDVGGRLVEFDGEGTVAKLSEPARSLAEELGLSIDGGENQTCDDFRKLIAAMADCVLDTATGPPFADRTRTLAIGSLPTETVQLDGVVFTGGVGRLVNTPDEAADAYGDAGSLLAAAVRDRAAALPVLQPEEDVRATVIGAGTQTMRLSGRTLAVDASLLPLRNLPVIGALDLGNICREMLFDRFDDAVATAEERHGPGEPFVLSIDDVGPVTYQRVKDVAKAIAAACGDANETGMPVVVLTRQNCAKALGQTLNSHLDGHPILTIDEVEADEGDYLDIGSPLADSDTVPVVVKTLAFGG